MAAKAIVGVAGERLGLMRAMFLELTAGSEAAVSGMRPAFSATLGVLAEYMTNQMDIGRMRRMHPLLALQAFIGPIFFHLLSRPVLERFTEIPMTPQEAVDELMTVIVAGLDQPRLEQEADDEPHQRDDAQRPTTARHAPSRRAR